MTALRAKTADVMPALLAACPSFADAWRAHQAEWADLDSPLVYIDVAAFADHMAMKLHAGETEEFPAVFRVAERLLLEGNGQVRTLIGVGLFEDMQGSAHRLGGFWLSSRFRPWLGAKSVEVWDSVSEFRYGTTDEPSVLAARAVALHRKRERQAIWVTVVLVALFGLSLLLAVGWSR